MDLRNSNSSELRNSYFTTVWKLFSNIFIISGNAPCGAQFIKDIDLWESHAKVHKNRVKLWELIQFKG